MKAEFVGDVMILKTPVKSVPEPEFPLTFSQVLCHRLPGEEKSGFRRSVAPAHPAPVPAQAVVNLPPARRRRRRRRHPRAASVPRDENLQKPYRQYGGTKNMICPAILEKGKCYLNCAYAHNDREIEVCSYPGSTKMMMFYKTRMCQYRNRCVYGVGCSYAHYNEELRLPGQDMKEVLCGLYHETKTACCFFKNIGAECPYKH